MILSKKPFGIWCVFHDFCWAMASAILWKTSASESYIFVLVKGNCGYVDVVGRRKYRLECAPLSVEREPWSIEFTVLIKGNGLAPFD